ARVARRTCGEPQRARVLPPSSGGAAAEPWAATAPGPVSRRGYMPRLRLALRVALPIVLLWACTPVARAPATARQVSVYAVWPHSDYKPWQADAYARDPQLVLRELDWMHDVGINTYLPLA